MAVRRSAALAALLHSPCEETWVVVDLPAGGRGGAGTDCWEDRWLTALFDLGRSSDGAVAMVSAEVRRDGRPVGGRVLEAEDFGEAHACPSAAVESYRWRASKAPDRPKCSGWEQVKRLLLLLVERELGQQVQRSASYFVPADYLPGRAFGNPLVHGRVRRHHLRRTCLRSRQLF